jgi:hypothetical protein
LTAKKKLAGAFGGVVAIGATIALTAGTFSYFSDSANSTGGGGDVAFGTVKLTLLNDSADTPFVVTKAKPGATVSRRTSSASRTAAISTPCSGCSSFRRTTRSGSTTPC